MNLDWNAIRPLDGSQSKGFEELCVQLARLETPSDAEFVRKGTPDAGVECFCKLQDGSEWGWQAKYFTTSLTGVQWQQLDDSVKSALEGHPGLIRYYVCVPLDRSDARRSDQQSFLQKWETRVSKWKCWAQEHSMNVEFVWWGSSELLDRLSREEKPGRVYFWFDSRHFDGDWFRDRLNEAHETAGPRYTPEVHIDLPICRELDLFGRADAAFDRIKSLAIDIRRMLQQVRYALPDNDDSSHTFNREELSQSIGLEELYQSEDRALQTFAALEPAPAGELPLHELNRAVEAIEKLARKASRKVPGLWSAYSSPSERESRSPYSQHPLASLRGSLMALESTLSSAQLQISRANDIANNNLLILKGMAGTGKTHLLCDFARKRIELGAPTVLLMGQWFTTSEVPWTQVLQQLDLHDATAEKFVGALEAAAQASNSRALVVIDALNEERGHEIWPSHLAAFLARLEQSPWIGTVLSVRTTYEEVIVPEDVRERAVVLTHEGFANREYDAVQTYFSYFGLELPSAPILQPEFSNPLLLKVLCEGLHRRGETKLTMGIHGITGIFDLYLKSVNDFLAKLLDYDPHENLVEAALSRIGEELADRHSRSLPMEAAKEIVNTFLPDRTYSSSLYRGLVTEGILLEDTDWINSESNNMVVSIAYDRLADHIVADHLLKAHLNECDPNAAFTTGGGLGFLGDKDVFTRDGLIEALCVQIPERTGMELVRLAPELLDRPNFGQTFRQSIVWRDLSAFSEDTRAVLNDLIRYESDLEETLDTLLMVATVEEHPFNASLLDECLSQHSMPNRDEWWSTYLHHAWEYDTGNPVHRLIDWANGVSSSVDIHASTIDLSAVTLAWTLTSSNRFLRDRATKALVSLLTNRLDAAMRLIERFYDVDDPYVTERLYAVTYGVAMRSHDAAAVGNLASIVYERVFASGNPPAHILLRDYARGVIERALHLGSTLKLDADLIRPPYKSNWPEIPDERAIETLVPDLSRDSDDCRESECSPHRIEFSVMHDDFARYVIGTNSRITNWLSLRLEESTWLSHKERIEVWKSKLSARELDAWEEYENRHNEGPITITLSIEGERAASAHFTGLNGVFRRVEIASLSDGDQRELEEVTERAEEESKNRLFSALREEHRAELESILRIPSDYWPSFDLSQIQRYVLWRVFDLGWTTERFGRFDSQFSHRYQRDAAKPERIGKKYQWIAYHEILAYIADHFQYRDKFSNEGGDMTYEGPWQELLRDVDPSSTLASTPGGTSWEGHRPSWWGSLDYTAWDKEKSHRDWIMGRDDIPQIDQLLHVTDTEDGTRWLNAYGYFAWQQSHPADSDPSEIDRREMWFLCTAYFICDKDAANFIDWAKSVDFWGRWMPDPPKTRGIFLGEYGWSQAFRHLNEPSYGLADWETPKNDCPTSVQPASIVFSAGSGDFDCSVEESYSLHLPQYDFVTRLGLRWSGKESVFVDQLGHCAAFDPTAYENGPTALLIREDSLKRYLADAGLSMVWVAIGEKHVLGRNYGDHFNGSLRMSGAYLYSGLEPEGSLKFQFEEPRDLG